jgi:hypothetical protein
VLKKCAIFALIVSSIVQSILKFRRRTTAVLGLLRLGIRFPERNSGGFGNPDDGSNTQPLVHR